MEQKLKGAMMMVKMEKGLKGQFSLLLIRLIGLFTIFVGVKELLSVNNHGIIFNLIAIALFYLFFSPLSVTLPSGANWRPGMAFILFSILYFDYRLVILVAIPGTLFIARGKTGYLNSILLTLGHLSIGIYAAGIVRGLINIEFSANLVSYIVITLCLFVHFCFNRLVAALIVAQRKQRSVLKQVYLVRKDLNWGYFCAYILGILMFLVFRVYSVPGMLLVILLLISIFQAFTYFQKLKDIEEKVYIDVLTGAESRMSWEEYQKQLDKAELKRSGIIFMMDLDQFKMMNDTFGHEFGDRILKEFVSYMKTEMRRKFRLFRYGGDEFILVVSAPAEEYSDVYSEVSTMIYLLNQRWEQQDLAVSVSFGSASLSVDESIANIVRKADKLMYLHKFKKNLTKTNNGTGKMLIKSK
jgi:diguanylate cyclase (GGDEF)-like protein